MKDLSDAGKSWFRRCGQEDDRRRSHGIGFLLSGVLFMLSGTIVGLLLSGQFSIAGVTYASLIVSGGFGYWLCGCPTASRKPSDSHR